MTVVCRKLGYQCNTPCYGCTDCPPPQPSYRTSRSFESKPTYGELEYGRKLERWAVRNALRGILAPPTCNCEGVSHRRDCPDFEMTP